MAMNPIGSNSGRTHSNSFDSSLKPTESVVGGRKKSGASIHTFMPHFKARKPLSELFSRFKRKNQKSIVPQLDFTQMHSQLLLELAYTASLVRQTIRPDNQQHLVSQLSECVRLIRVRVATGAACIQPVVHSSDSSGTIMAFSPANRVALEKLSRFHEAYVDFIDWINDLSVAELPILAINSTVPYQVGTSLNNFDPNMALSDRGHRLFAQLKNTSLAVFDSLKAYGFTTPIDPGQLESLVNRSLRFQECRPNGTNPPSPPPHTSPRDGGSSTILTESDRALLAKLWSHLDAALSTQITPPPKPPLPGTVSGAPPRFPVGLSSTDQSAFRNGSNSVDNPEFTAYLQLLANTVQSDGTVPVTAGETVVPNTISRPPLPPCSIRKSSVDLNAPDRLNFPLVDASDASDTDSGSHQIPWTSSRRSNSTGLIHSNSLFRLTDGISPLQSAQSPPDGTSTYTRPGFESWPHSDTQSHSNARSPKNQLQIDSPMQWSVFHPPDPANPLDDHNMQENIAIVAMRLQRAQSGSEVEPLENPLFVAHRDSGPTETTRFGRYVPPDHLESQALAGWNSTEPIYSSEVKADTEDDSELIEANGRKYLRHFQRHIMIERHKVKQLVVAPSLPDGSGPDWSRAVLTVDHSAYPVPPSLNATQDATDTASESIPGQESGAYSGSMSSDLDHGPNGVTEEQKLLDSARVMEDRKTASLTRSTHGVSAAEFSDGLDWDSDEPSVDVQTSTPPPKPPLPLMLRQGKRPLTNYMFRFGSSQYDDPDKDHRLSTQLFDLFRTHWHKQEIALGPHERTKTISYVERYTQQTPVGEFVRRSTCVQHTCTVRMVGGLEGLREKRGMSDASLEAKSESTTSSSLSRSPSPTGLRYKQLELDVGSTPSEVPHFNFSDTSSQSNSYHEDSVPERSSASDRPRSTTEIERGAGNGQLNNWDGLELIASCTAGSDILGLVRADEYLIWDESDSEAEVAVHAGCVDALIVYLTSFGKLMPPFFLFFETFLFTYQTFITPDDLIERLIRRYVLFRVPDRDREETDNANSSLGPTSSSSSARKVSIRSKVCISTASTLVTVVSRLKTDLNISLRERLLQFSRLLVMDNYISLSRLLTASIENQMLAPSRLSVNLSSLGCPRAPPSRAHSAEQVEPDHLSLNSLSLDHPPNQCGPSDAEQVGSQETGINVDSFRHDLQLPKSVSKPFAPLRGHNQLQPDARSASARSSIVSTDGENRLALSPLRPTLVSLSGTIPRGLRRKSASPAPYGSSSSTVPLLSFGAQELAEQLTYLEAEKYYQIQLNEVLDIASLERGKAPSVAQCALHFSSVCNWATFQMLSVAPTERDKLANRFLDVMECLHKLQNFSSYLSILCAFMLVPENLFSRKTRNRLSRVKPYMQPPYFSEYRRELEAAQPPFIPYLGLMMQHLIMLAQAHPLWCEKVPEKLASVHQQSHGRIVNFWRCWKHFLIIHFIVKQEKTDAEKARYHIKPNPEILRFLDDFKDSMPEADLRRLANRMRREAT